MSIRGTSAFGQSIVNLRSKGFDVFSSEELGLEGCLFSILVLICGLIAIARLAGSKRFGRKVLFHAQI
jgi:hypothetical protein